MQFGSIGHDWLLCFSVPKSNVCEDSDQRYLYYQGSIVLKKYCAMIIIASIMYVAAISPRHLLENFLAHRSIMSVTFEINL